jgi:hypothetical protein
MSLILYNSFLLVGNRHPVLPLFFVYLAIARSLLLRSMRDSNEDRLPTTGRYSDVRRGRSHDSLLTLCTESLQLLGSKSGRGLPGPPRGLVDAVDRIHS